MVTEIKPRPITFGTRLLSALRKLLDVITSIFFKLYYGTNGKKLPPIKDDILKQPAVEVARRIRYKEIGKIQGFAKRQERQFKKLKTLLIPNISYIYLHKEWIPQISSVEVINACIRRIKDTNSEVNCLVENRYELALEEAREVDKIIQSGSKTLKELENEKPFLGVPFTTKDSIAVKGLPLTAGLVLRKGVISDKDSDVVKLMKESGAIIIGLTNVPELCMWWETHNHVYGRTNNPYDTSRIVGGSSGGEGCIQALGGSCFGIGSDIGGSIRMPAYFNGIFGHKPSRLVVSNVGQYPEVGSEMENSLLCLGPMTKFAVDLKPILKILSGENSKKLNLNQSFDLKNLKIFYQINSGEPLTDKVDEDIETALKKVVEFFNKKHNIVAKEQNIEWLQQSTPIWFDTMKSEHPIGEYLIKNYSTFAVYKEIFKNVFGQSGNTLAVLFTALVDGEKLNPECEEYKYNLNVRQHLEDIFTNMLGDDGVFLYPTHPTPAPYHNQPMIKSMNFIYTAIINCLGLPATAVPLGLSRDGLPIGIQVIANHNNDRLCLSVAEELEKAFGGWIEPK